MFDGGVKMKKKFMKFRAPYQYAFDGNDELYGLVVNEAKTQFEVKQVINWRGNNYCHPPEIDDKIVVINKSNLLSYEEVEQK